METLLGIIIGILVLLSIFSIKRQIKIRKFRKSEEEFNRKCDILEQKIKTIYENECKRNN